MGKTKELIISIVIAVLLSKFVEYIWRNVSYSQNNVFLLGKVYTVVNDVRVKKFNEKVRSISGVILLIQGGQSLGEISKIRQPLTFSVPKRVIHIRVPTS